MTLTLSTVIGPGKRGIDIYAPGEHCNEGHEGDWWLQFADNVHVFLSPEEYGKLLSTSLLAKARKVAR